ncbi:MAG: archease [Candidatus Dadabacteria bacterium]|nr:MAG: archease [Candidatus Dadabacteria bacterium]
MQPFKFIEHTADIIIRSYGHSLEELFTNSAAGMQQYIFGELRNSRHGEPKTFEVNCQASSCDLLLADWLSEILYLNSTEYVRIFEFSFKILNENEVTSSGLAHKAQAINEIKAVTLHGLEVVKRNNTWTATVTYDI